MHHRGEHLGHFFLGDKEDGEAFTAEDEEILVLFASQAATAIANARTHRDVEQARANLEALRHKLGDTASTPAYIFNEHGVGYRMPDPHEA